MVGIGLQLTVLSFVVLMMQGCGGGAMTKSDTGDMKTNDKKADIVVMGNVKTGTLTEEGVMCRTMRGDDGALYTFEALPDELKAGDRVEVSVDKDNTNMASYCDQGQILHWSSITRMTRENIKGKTWVFSK